MNIMEKPNHIKNVEISLNDRQAEILRLTSEYPLDKKDFPTRPYLLLDTLKNDNGYQYIFLKQPYWGDIEMEYSDFDDLEDLIDQKIQTMLDNRIHQNYKSIRNTGTVFFNDHELIGVGLQDVNKHVFDLNEVMVKMLETKYSLTKEDIKILQLKHQEYSDSICIREMIKLEAHNLSDTKINQREDFYEICPGCTNDNHSESNALLSVIRENNLPKLKRASALVYRHWWSCKHCQEKLIRAGIKKIYLSRRWAKEYLQIS
jgi:deoxycytidylate deaminase